MLHGMRVPAPLFHISTRPHRGLKPLALRLALLSLCACSVQACAYPRRSTHVSPSPPGKTTGFIIPEGMYTLRILDAELPPRKNTGGTWDSDGTDPDAFVRVIIADRTVWESEVIDDKQHPEWNVTLPANVLIGDNDKLRIEIWDSDSGTDGDPLGYSSTTGLPVNARPNSEASLTLNNLATLRIMVSPPRPHQGVGLKVEIHPDEIQVLEVNPHSPAGRAGIKEGDRIVEIGPRAVSHMADDEALSNLSLAADRHKKLIILDAKGKRREVDLDDQPLWLVL